MKKRWSKGIMFLCMIIILSFAAEAGHTEEAGYTEKETKVFNNGTEDGTLPLRFYEETPHVACMGMKTYAQYMLKQPFALREEGGMFILANSIGEEIVCDADAGRITVNDWNRFFDLPLPLEDEALGWKDTSTRFARITGVDYEPEPAVVVLDLARYGIPVHADQDDIYLPVSVLSNIMTDTATNHMLYNGENLYAMRMSLDGSMPEDFWRSDMYKAQFGGQERPEDLIQQCYADLCFNLDYFFGHPGIARLDKALAEKGLDQALAELGEEGRSLKEGLLSPNLLDYIDALNRLFTVYLADGHTLFSSSVSLLLDEEYASNVSLVMKADPLVDLLESPTMMRQLAHETIPLQRNLVWGDDVYRESGSTAIIRLDTFMPDEAAWESYYSGEGDFPEDCLGTVITGLRRASENPGIENVIFDLSCNSGGSPDVMMAILAVTTGQDQLYGLEKLTDQRSVFTFEADTNFDGVYDEKDREVRYDYNYGVLTTRHAFSCGNLFPIIAQEAGVVIIGEPTSGGSCCVRVGSDSQGFNYMMSDAKWQLTDSQGTAVEGGCVVDLPIETRSVGLLDRLVSTVGVEEGLPSFLSYFDGKKLDTMMNEWFAEEAQADLAA